MKTYLKNGWILTGEADMEAIGGKCIVIEDGKIAAIMDEVQNVSDGENIDLKGKYIMPGLINLHVHLPASGKPKKKESDPKRLVKLMTSNALLRALMIRLCEGYAKTELMSGVTTLRTVGGVEDVDTTIRNRTAQG